MAIQMPHHFLRILISVWQRQVRQDVRQTLRQTRVKEFQPDYIDGQINAVRSDFRRSLKQLAANPHQSDRIIDGFTDRLQNRIDKIYDNIDHENSLQQFTNSTDLSRAQAESTVDQYMDCYSKVVSN